jgi:predicted Zn-dependent peptidase
MFFTNPFSAGPRDRLTARLVELILTSRLRDRVREELSATYSIEATVDLQREPDAFAEASIVSTGDPNGLEEISSAVLAELAELESKGPTGPEFETSIAQLRDEMELTDNPTMASALVTARLYPDQPVTEIRDRYALVDTITPGDVRAMMGVVFDLGQRIEVRQVPRT